MASIIVSLTPKAGRISVLLQAAKKSKCTQDLIFKSLGLYLSTDEGKKMEESILVMGKMKDNLAGLKTNQETDQGGNCEKSSN